MILYINACVREASRTKRLADYLLSKLGDAVKEIRLDDLTFAKADEDYLKKRDRQIQKKAYDDPMFEAARTFAGADTIVIAAPFWDLSFPAALKQYFEQINVLGLTFAYTSSGTPAGLCRAKTLYYVTTAGGKIFSEEYGYGYVKALANGFYGIRQTRLIKAENLDVAGADTAQILDRAKKEIDSMMQTGR